MKIVQILGGLGNQMFQFAFYLALKKKYQRAEIDISQFEYYSLHNGYELEKVFGIKAKQPSQFYINLYYNPHRKFLFRKLKRLLGLKHVVYKETEEFNYTSQALSDIKAKYYVGYWQNELYFKDIQGDVRKAFCFRNELDQSNTEYLKRIKDSNSVSIHVRRGDYINHPVLGEVCDIDYYKRAINEISKRVINPLFFIFSNDLAWCKENIVNEKITYIEGNIHNGAIDMELMSNCKHQVIANSSFSWWGAWLNSNPAKIVIAPQKWINTAEIKEGLIPEDWIKI